MKFSTQISQAVDRCLNDAIPFVAFAMPGEREIRFYASLPDAALRSPAFRDNDSDCFFINFFDNDEPYTAGVRFDMSAEDVLRFNDPTYRRQTVGESAIRPRITATFRASYHAAFAFVKPRLKKDGGKVVLSRLRSVFTKKTPVCLAEDYFSLTDSTFRYLCYTPETGVWLGSTPETLLESDLASGCIRTMSLAGTRPADDCGEWDEKNIREQAIVTDYICRTLLEAGMTVETAPLTERRFLNIKHLCTPIEARGGADIPLLLSALSPTPAVAGYPRERALDEIYRVETHRRHCYGGYVGVRTAGDYQAYVNLRCAFLAPAEYDGDSGWLGNLYAGGGLVAASREDDEWLETESKTRALAAIFLGADGSGGCEGPGLTPSSVRFLSDTHQC